MSPTTFTNGDRVTPDSTVFGPRPHTLGRVFIVQRVNPKNIVAKPEDGVGPASNYPKAMWLPATPENVQAGRDAAARGGVARVTAIPTQTFEAGEIVTLVKPYEMWTTDRPLVVTAVNARSVSVVSVGGGDSGRYMRVPHAGLVKRDRAWLAASLTAALEAA